MRETRVAEKRETARSLTSYIHVILVFTSLHINSRASSVFKEQCLASSSFLAGSLLASLSLFGHLLWLNKERQFSAYIYFKVLNSNQGIH